MANKIRRPDPHIILSKISQNRSPFINIKIFLCHVKLLKKRKKESKSRMNQFALPVGNRVVHGEGTAPMIRIGVEAVLTFSSSAR